MFENTNQNLGSIKEGTKKVIEFPYSNVASIIQTVSSCGCTVGEADKQRQILVVFFTAKPVPPHLWGQGWYTTCQTVTVVYTSTTDPNTHLTQELKFTVTVVK